MRSYCRSLSIAAYVKQVDRAIVALSRTGVIVVIGDADEFVEIGMEKLPSELVTRSTQE